MHRIVIEFDPATGNFQTQQPDDTVTTLGMLAFFQEMLLMQRVRPQVTQAKPMQVIEPPKPVIVPSTQ